MRAILILTCGGVSFAHGTNDGQKSLGLIMLTVIGLAPLTYALNQSLEPAKVRSLMHEFQQAGAMIGQYGDSKMADGVAAANDATHRLAGKPDLNRSRRPNAFLCAPTPIGCSPNSRRSRKPRGPPYRRPTKPRRKACERR